MVGETLVGFLTCVTWALGAQVGQSQTQTINHAPGTTPIRAFFDNMSPDPTGMYRKDMLVLTQLSEQLQTAQPSEISSELNVLSEKMQDSDDRIRRYAALFLMQIARRPDAGDLLAPQVGFVTAQFQSPDPTVRGISVVVARSIGRSHPDEVVPKLEMVLKSSDAPTTVGPAVVGTLLDIAPRFAGVDTAISNFMARPDQTTSTRVATVMAVQRAPADDIPITKALISYLTYPNDDVKSRVLFHLSHVRGNALEQARPAIERLTASEAESPRIRQHALNALSGPLTGDPSQ